MEVKQAGGEVKRWMVSAKIEQNILILLLCLLDIVHTGYLMITMHYVYTYIISQRTISKKAVESSNKQPGSMLTVSCAMMKRC